MANSNTSIVFPKKNDILMSLKGVVPEVVYKGMNPVVPYFKHKRGWRLGTGPDSAETRMIYLTKSRDKIRGKVHIVKVVDTQPQLVAILLPKSVCWSLIPKWKKRLKPRKGGRKGKKGRQGPVHKAIDRRGRQQRKVGRHGQKKTTRPKHRSHR